MNSMMRLALCVAVMSLVAGCASTKQYVRLPDQSKTLENPELSRIYVMRPAVVGGAIPMAVYDNDKLIGSTGPKGYLCWEREPGKIKVSSKAENTCTVELDAKNGSDYFFLQYVKVGFAIARTKLELIDEAQGREILNKCKPPAITSP